MSRDNHYDRLRSTTSTRRSPFRGRIEQLESRQLLAALPVISEFVANNRDSLQDGSIPPASPDWIEIYNAGDSEAALDGWYLTDEPINLTKWSIPPNTSLPAAGYLVVFASGNGVPDAAGNLHTNFQLDNEGEYVALVMPDKITVASEFGAAGTDYPPQVADVSYGLVMQPTVRTFVSRGTASRVMIPTSEVIGDWTGGDPAFIDDPASSNWFAADTALGFSPLEAQNDVTATDIESAMRFVNSSALIRIPFEVDDPALPDGLTLNMAYDDGFVAYLNGQQIAAVNAPATPAFNATATAGHDALGSVFTPDPSDLSILYDFEEDGGQAVTDKLAADGQQNPVFNSGGSVDTNPDNAAFGSRSLRLPQSPTSPSFFNRIRLPGTSLLGQQFTLAMQANLTSSSFQRLFSNYNGTGPVEDNRLILDVDPSGAQISGLRVLIGGRGALETSGVPPQLAAAGYHHFAMTYDNGDVQVYLDGELVLSGTLGNGSLEMPLDLYLGEDPHDGGGTAKEQLVGNVDDVLVLSNVALPPADIRLLAQQGAAALFDSGGREPLFEAVDVSAHLDELRAGTNILAIQGLNISADDNDFFLLPELVATILPDGQPPAYFVEPTPGAINSTPIDGIVGDTRFTVDRGFYDSPFEVNITVDTPGATIVYTTDGSQPTQTNGIQVAPTDPTTTPTATVPIETTTILRAAGFKEDFASSNVDAQTYIFLDDVIRQPTEPPGLPSFWGPTRADYGMDANVVDVLPYSETIVDDLKSIPTMSLTLNADEFFGPSGIYSNTQSRGRVWERPVSVEYFDAQHRQEFQVNAGLRVHGGFSRDPTASPQHSLRLHFRSEYGPGKLDFPLFDDSPVTQFDALVLNAQSSDNWSSINLITGRVAQFMRDQWAQDMQREMGHVHVPGTYVHLYINGLYWGLYDVMERLDDSFAAEHWGGNEEEYDIIIDEVAFRGNLTAWNDLLNRVRAGDYERALELLDVDNFIDYLIVNMHMGNWDWPDHNWHAVRRRAEGEKFQFVVWDAEVGMGLDVNVPGPIRPRVLDVDLSGNRSDVSSSVLRNGPGEIYNRLRTIPEFQLRFADRLHKHFFNDGALTPERAGAVYETRANEIAAALVGQSARWGDVRREPPDVPDGTWLSEKNWILNTFFPLRSDIVLDDFRDEDLYPDLAAPLFNQHGGAIASGFELTMSHDNIDGMILYTLDGSDPRVVGGNISPSARQYSDPVAISDNTTVSARVLSNGEWSALNQAVFSLSLQPIRITEINYHPFEPTNAEEQALPGVDADDFEFIELQNAAVNTAINLAGYSLAGGVSFSFPASSIGPGEHVVIVEDVAAFRARYGDAIRVLGQWNGGLSNAGENLILADALGNPITEVEYGDAGLWPERADGNGGTLELIQPRETPASELGKHFNWRGSTEFGGSPGTDGTGPTGVVVNEVLAHTDPAMAQSDAIELFNTTDQPIDMSGWFLSDSARNFFKFEIPAGTVLGAGQYIVFDENSFNPNPTTPGPNDFALSGVEGDDVWVVIPGESGGVAAFVDEVHFPATLNGETLGRVPDGSGRLAPLGRNALGCTNRHPRVGPVVISEINFNPGEPTALALAIDSDLVEDDLEFIEIYNPTSGNVDLTNWRLRGGVDFDFAAATELAAQATLIVTSFNPSHPANTDRLDAFRTHYGIDASVQVLGGFGGQLSDSGERIHLQSPDEPPVENSMLIPHVTEDALVYDDRAPWPDDADGTGGSLTRLSATVFADASTSWIAVAPTPGTVDFSAVPVGDLTGDGQVDADDIDVLFDAVNADSLVNFYDIDANDSVNHEDVRTVLETILTTSFGDANLDGSIDGEDFGIWRAHRFTACTGWSAADFNGDGVTDVADFNVWNENRFLVAAVEAAAHDKRVPRTPMIVQVIGVAGVDPLGTSGEPPAERTGGSWLVPRPSTPATRMSKTPDDVSPELSLPYQIQRTRQFRRPVESRPSATVQEELVDYLFAALDEPWKLL